MIQHLPPKQTVIRLGAVYIYRAAFPEGCKGCHYKVHRFVFDVPSYQHKVLVEALDGMDKGVWFTCTLDNFSTRYDLTE